jgi:hypothetical protein
MSADPVLQRVETLLSAMDTVVESISDVDRQSQADWAWYRLHSIAVLVRDDGAGALAGSLARGLLEQAAYWDWAVATGVGMGHTSRWAATEYERLKEVADQIDDDVWLGWVLPPGVALSASPGLAIPRNLADAVGRIGHGQALEPFELQGLVAAYQLLGILSHSNLGAAAVLSRHGGQGLSDPLAASILHVAAAGATAVVTAEAGPSAANLVPLALRVAEAAVPIHGLALGFRTASQRPAKASAVADLNVPSTITLMPGVPGDLLAAADAFIKAADAFVSAVNAAADDLPEDAWAAWISIQLSWEQMQVVRGTVTGTLGRALLPTAARLLFEDGARWGWLRRRAAAAPTGDSFRALIEDSARHIDKVKRSLASAGVSTSTVDQLLGRASQVFAGAPLRDRIPEIGALVSAVHGTPSGVNSARPMYSWLSQFVHSTPLAVMHLKRDELPSVTAPTFAVAIEAACRGFTEIALTTTTLAGASSSETQAAAEVMIQRLSDIIIQAARWHCLG